MRRVTKITSNEGTYSTMVNDAAVNKVPRTDEESNIKETYITTMLEKQSKKSPILIKPT